MPGVKDIPLIVWKNVEELSDGELTQELQDATQHVESARSVHEQATAEYEKLKAEADRRRHVKAEADLQASLGKGPDAT